MGLLETGSKMNIVYYLSTFPKLSESFILNEIYELVQKEHNVAVCALKKPDELIAHEEFNELDIPVYYINGPTHSNLLELFSTKTLHPRILSNIFYRAPPRTHAANLLRAKQCIEFIDSLDWEPDQFHSHFAKVPMFAAKYASDYYKVPFTITTHAVNLYKEPVGSYTKSLLQKPDRIVTISEYNKKYIQKQFVSKTPIDIVRAGIRPEKFVPTELSEPNRILSISRFVEKKGLSYALKAVSIAVEQIPNIEYHIIGSGKLKPKLVQETQQLGIEENVLFLDNVTDHRLVTELDEARAFLLPCVISESGDRDGIPVVLMEAMAMKTPPVSTTVSGIPELIEHQQNGLLTEPRDPEATADALLELLRNDSDWAIFSERARQKVCAEFNIKSEVDKLETTFREAQIESQR
ncbi:glycosyltransferase [Natronoglomus mannanivorans]|uniref:Glycosyltransferase n=1 Tax=Natronoglomus mannanivorans TaxID=2979990 RepID=A0AAP2Z0X6_9EURY|nr:glycosyltransferase [Halobacteria archaeon AArc-xg1-1]